MAVSVHWSMIRRSVWGWYMGMLACSGVGIWLFLQIGVCFNQSRCSQNESSTIWDLYQGRGALRPSCGNVLDAGRIAT